MFSHRFQEQMQETPPPAAVPAGFAFMPLPMAQGTDWMQSIYQLAMAEAQKDALAERRARMLAASLN